MSAPRRLVETIRFAGPAGELEGLWSSPGGGEAAAVICHPHPAHRGSMHSKVVHTIYRVLEERGHPTLRFNFRGVGLSEGAYAGWDEAVGDVAAAAAEARLRSGRRPLWLAGFSFGSYVGAKWALADGGVERYLGLGMPVSRNIDGRTFDFLDRAFAPTLIVQGDRDQYGDRDGILALAGRLRKTGRVTVRFVDNADHFFTGRLAALADALRDGLDREEP